MFGATVKDRAEHYHGGERVEPTRSAVLDRDFSPIGRLVPSKDAASGWRVRPHVAFRGRFPDLDAETYPLEEDAVVGTFDHVVRVDRSAKELADRWRG